MAAFERGLDSVKLQFSEQLGRERELVVTQVQDVLDNLQKLVAQNQSAVDEILHKQLDTIESKLSGIDRAQDQKEALAALKSELEARLAERERDEENQIKKKLSKLAHESQSKLAEHVRELKDLSADQVKKERAKRKDQMAKMNE